MIEPKVLRVLIFQDQKVQEVRSPEYNRPHTPPHQIVRNTYNQEISINENILIMSAKNLASLDESKVFDDVILTNFFVHTINTQSFILNRFH